VIVRRRITKDVFDQLGVVEFASLREANPVQAPIENETLVWFNLDRKSVSLLDDREKVKLLIGSPSS
jgi:hypothetical protein